MKVEKIDDTTWGVGSSSGGGSYTINCAPVDADDSDEVEYTCDCKAFEFGGGKHCKHIRGVLANRERLGT